MDHAVETEGTKNAEIADTVQVSVRWVQKLWTRYKGVTPGEPRSTGPFPAKTAKEDDQDASGMGIVYPLLMGRPPRRSATRIEHYGILGGNLRRGRMRGT